MTKESAREILLAYRPGTADHNDPEIAEALRIAQRDPELSSWLEQQASFHQSIRDAVRAVPVPKDLRARILAQQSARPNRQPALNRIVTGVWFRPAFLLAAACFVLAFVLAGLWFQRRTEDESLAGFRSRMVSNALRVYGMDIQTNDMTQVRAYLRSQGAPSDYALSPHLESVPLKGAARLSWQGHPVSMLCFDLSRNRSLWMFVVDQTAVPAGERLSSAPVVGEEKGLSIATWRKDGKVYLVAASVPPESIKTLLGSDRQPGV